MIEIEETDDERFARTGVFCTSFNIEVTVTEEDMLRDLIKKTEGKNLKPDEPGKN